MQRVSRRVDAGTQLDSPVPEAALAKALRNHVLVVALATIHRIDCEEGNPRQEALRSLPSSTRRDRRNLLRAFECGLLAEESARGKVRV